MSTVPETGGPAFPSGLIDPSTPEDAVQSLHNGMTLRDYFAAKAMPFILERWTKDAIKDKQPSLLECDGAPTDIAFLVAGEAYSMADAMLKARGE